MKTIQLDRKQFIKTLSSIKEDNVSIANVQITRRNLLEALKLQTQDGSDIMTLTYGKMSWQGKKESKYDSHYVVIDNEPCLQFNCNHTTMRFLNRPVMTRQGEIKVIPLNFTQPITEYSGIPINPQDLLDGLNKVSHCMASETIREVLHAILFESTSEYLKLVAADGYRLGVVKLDISGLPQDKVIIDRDDITRLLAFLRAVKPTGKGRLKEYPEVYLSYNENSITFQSVNGILELPVMGKKYHYPDYEKLIPTTGTHIEFIASDMLQSAKALSNVCKEGSGIIRLYCSKYPDRITLKARSEQLADTESECPARVDVEHQIAVSVNYLMDFLKTAKDNLIDLFLQGSSYPMVFYNTENYCETVMPMFVQW